jgi:pimeloyl-ACP methyl ester carboxylesterase
MRTLLPYFLAGVLAAVLPLANAGDKPTIVLVHGAFADGASWNGVTSILRKQGYPVVAVANPLRSVHGDASYLGDVLHTIQGPVVLVGHSYGGLVIGETATSGHDVTGLVFVAAFAADTGETAATLSAKDPGSTLGPALAPPVKLADGNVDLYIRQDLFPEQFAADVAKEEAALMAASQRPVTELALNDPAKHASWKTTPSWFIYGDADRNIPASVLGFMADRASSRKTVVMEGASHVVMVSHPRAVAELIIEAAKAPRQ